MVEAENGLDQTGGKRVVQLCVLPLPADPTKVAGEVRMNDPDPTHTVSFHRSSVMGIDSALKLACKIASERKAEFIEIVDPKDLLSTGVVDASAFQRSGQLPPS